MDKTMRERKHMKLTKAHLGLYGLCAGIWTMNTFLKLSGGAETWDIGLTLFCAVTWYAVLAVSVARYRGQAEEEDGGAE